MKKMSFPRITLPTIVVGSCLLNNILLLIAMLGIFALLGHQFNLTIFWLILLTFIVVILSMGIGLILGVMNVFLRDIGQVVPIVLQMLFWFTPIVYPITIIPEAYRYLLNFNPLYHVTYAFQNVLVYSKPPEWHGLLVVILISILFLALSLFMFRKASAEIVDVL